MRIATLVALTAGCLALFAGSAWGYQELDVQIPTRSGILIEAWIELPDDYDTSGAAYPSVVFIHGYGGNRADRRGSAQAYADDGYVTLSYSTRGFGNSEGSVSAAGPGEIDDLEDIVSYLIDNFRIAEVPAGALGGQYGQYLIGTTGISYGGGHSYLISARDPRVRTIAPVIPWTDLYQSLSPNGVPKLIWGSALFAAGVAFSQGDNTADSTYEWYVTTGVLAFETENYRNGLADRSVFPKRASVNLPIFAVQGLSDTLFPGNEATRLFTAFKTEKPSLPFKMALVNDPSHSPLGGRSGGESAYWNAQIARWFEYWLKGIDNGIMDDPRVDVVFPRTPNFDIDDPTRVLRTSTWPVPGTTNRTFYLRRSPQDLGGDLREDDPPTSADGELPEGLSHTVANPLDFATDPFVGLSLAEDQEGFSVLDIVCPPGTDPCEIPADDVVVFRTPPLAEPLTVVGEPLLNAFFASSANTMDLTFRIFDFDPAATPGSERTLVSQGRSAGRRFFDLVLDDPPTLACASAFHQTAAEGFTIAHTFPAGHQIQLTVSNTELGHYSANRTPSENVLYHDVCVDAAPPIGTGDEFDRASHLILPVIPTPTP